jgi:multiple sugar transport system permease protein
MKRVNDVDAARGAVRMGWRDVVARRVLLLGAVLLAVGWMIPLAWMLVMSVSPSEEIFGSGLLPSRLTAEHYRTAWDEINMARLLFNTAVVSVGAVVGQVLLAAMAGYAFARLRFPGRRVIFVALLITMMVPFEVLVIPLFLAVRALPLLGGNDLLGQGGVGAMNSHLGIMLPNLITVYGVFLFRQLFLSFPREIEEASIIDGATRRRFFWRILLPNAKPAITTMGILAFLWTWNDFLWPLIVVRDSEMFTVQIGLAFFNEQFGTRWGPMMAGSVVATVPVVVLFLLAQRRFFSVGVRAGVKG